jgi:hypothetical protein
MLKKIIIYVHTHSLTQSQEHVTNRRRSQIIIVIINSLSSFFLKIQCNTQTLKHTFKTK